MSRAPSSGWKRTTLALLLFGVSFGYIEAAVVAYLRALPVPVSQPVDPRRSQDDLFPLTTLDQLKADAPDYLRLLKIEVVREAATLALLASVALAVSATVRQWLAAVVVAFGVWDISFYAFLRLLLGWPRSWFTWDLLFLIPAPWVGPVLAPILVSLSMVAGGLVVLAGDWRGWPVHLKLLHWLGIVAGGIILVVAFTWDRSNILAGGMPNPFNWPLFILGEAVGVGALLHAVWKSSGGVATEHSPR